MIPVQLATEPAIFDNRVRKPGAALLAQTPGQAPKSYAKHAYWRRILVELHSSYSGICAYSCHWIPRDTGFNTVEHFKPKGKVPQLAYEWNNYRLVCGILNGRKGYNTDVIDPFKIGAGWFALDFPSLLIQPGAGLTPYRTTRVLKTIARLRLNDDETCVQARYRYVMDYRNALITWDALQRDAPFIASELQRQGLVNTLNTIM